MKRHIITAVLCAGALLWSGCSEDNPQEPNTVPFTREEAADNARTLVPGTVIETEWDDDDDDDDDSNGWEVRVRTEGGGIVKIEYDEFGTLHEIEGETPPFDYEVTPGDGFIPFSLAKQIALTERPGAIEEWKLERDESDDRWEYRFEIRDDAAEEWRVEIDAANGAVLDVQES